MDEFWKRITLATEENDLDPDEAKSTLCFACELPIFSTPFKSFPPNTPLPVGSPDFRSPDAVILHDECAKLPQELHGHALHPHQPLILRHSWGNKYRRWNTASCGNCGRVCGDTMYECSDSQCRFHLELICALQIRILHRIHQHRLTAIRNPHPSFSCDACGVHHGNRSDLSYLCNICSFRLHPECALLPNAVVENHQHALRLSYDLEGYICRICGDNVTGFGVYFCGKCRYYVHSKCAMSDPQRCKPVLIRDAKFADVLHFPLQDEYTSVVRYILDNTTGDDWHPHQIEGEFSPEEIHEHTLIFHDQDDIDQLSSRVCNACVRLISPPFYSCSICPNFFLHDCCARLPRKVVHSRHREYLQQEHALHLVPTTASESEIPTLIICRSCGHDCNGFIYSCKICHFEMDVICTLMPPTITHESHGKSHILYMNYNPWASRFPNCCNLSGMLYMCSRSCSFQLHAKCAVLPRTITHKHDQHPLKLTANSAILAATDDQHRLFCEMCESSITDTHMKRCYSCNECDQLFHSDCIPSLRPFVRNGATIRVSCHACPLALVGNYGGLDYKCGHCSDDIRCRPSDWRAERRNYEWVYECSRGCYFRIHEDCAPKCLIKS